MLMPSCWFEFFCFRPIKFEQKTLLLLYLVLVADVACFFQRLFTVEELALYNGSDGGLPILLGILGYSLFLFLHV
jgi:hypothetical protein